MINELMVADFKVRVWEKYTELGRHDLPWRQPEADGHYDAYKIMVSEIMLQQTQVKRVIPKYEQFLKQFPTIQQLAGSEQAAVIKTWSGLGYNRRARYLHLAAREVSERYNGTVPKETQALASLPGIGPNTAGAIAAYAFNQPVIFIETNIRSVFIHSFFNGRDNVTDREITTLIEQTLDVEEPRAWYWALTDYGAHLKQVSANPSRASRHYTKQAPFQGSARQLRGQVLRLLSDGPLSQEHLKRVVSDDRLGSILSDLTREQLIRRKGANYHL